MAPIPFSLLGHFLLGVLLSARGASPPAASVLESPLALALVYDVLVLLPLSVFAQLAYPEWSWLYDEGAQDRALYACLPLVMLHLALLVAGYVAGWTLRRRAVIEWLALLGAAVALLLVAAFLAGARLWQVGTVGEFQAGRAAWLLDTKLGWSALFGTVASAVGLVLLLRAAIRHPRSV